MGGKPRYVRGHAVIRIDDGPLDDLSSMRELESHGGASPEPGPPNVSVKEVVTTAEEARREIMRLNVLNADIGCSYFWQSTHIFSDGGSHGSAGRAASGSDGQAEPAASDGSV